MIDLPSPVRAGDKIKAETINALIEAVRRSRPLPSSTIKVSQGMGGTLLEVVGEFGSSTTSKVDDVSLFPYKLKVFKETIRDDNTGSVSYRYFTGCYLPSGSCVVNGGISDLSNSMPNVIEYVNTEYLSEEDKKLLEGNGGDWKLVTPSSSNRGELFVHVLEEKISDSTGEIGDDSYYIVTNSSISPYTAEDSSSGEHSVKRIKWTFRVGSVGINDDGSMSVTSQVLNTALLLSSGNNGENGGYYIPSVDSNGNLTFTPSKTGSMPDVSGSWNIRGTTGAIGPTGPTGDPGEGMTEHDWQILNEAITAATGAAADANDAKTSANQAAQDANEAATKAENAATSANQAASNASSASQSATDAATSATEAAQSATDAATDATNAATSATEAAQDASDAANSVNEAVTSATEAAQSATDAATEATNAATEARQAIEDMSSTMTLFGESAESFVIDKNGLISGTPQG